MLSAMAVHSDYCCCLAVEESERGLRALLYTQRRVDFIFQSEMPSGTLPPALDLNRQELLGRIEG